MTGSVERSRETSGPATATHAAHPPGAFTHLIVSEQKSIGREMAETDVCRKRLAEADVEIFEYVHGRSLTPRDYLAKMMAAMQAGVDGGTGNSRVSAVHEAHTRYHQMGHVVGGRVFGYRNVHIFHATDRARQQAPITH